MRTRIAIVAGLSLCSLGCDGKVTFCVQYVNTSDIVVAFQAVDATNTKLEDSVVSIDPPSDTGDIYVSGVITLTGVPPITISAPNQFTGGQTCVIPSLLGENPAGQIYRVEATSFATFECVQEGPCQ